MYLDESGVFCSLQIYCGHGFGINGKGIVSRAALLEIELNSENFTQRAVQVSEMVLGESLSKFSVSGSCQDEGRTVKKLPQDAMRAVRSKCSISDWKLTISIQ